MTEDYSARLRRLLTMPAEALSAPLWTFPAADRLAVLGARRRRFSGLPEDADERVTEFAETE